MKNLEALPPRFKGCPPICVKANLPTFESVKAARDWHSTESPSCIIDSVDACKACEGFHVAGHFLGPSGGSSGSSTRHLTGRLTAKELRHNGDMSDDQLRRHRLMAVTAPTAPTAYLPRAAKAVKVEPAVAEKAVTKSLQPKVETLF